MTRRKHRHAVLGTLAALLGVTLTASAHTEITAAQAHDMIAAGGVIVVDVREYSEFCSSSQHVVDAVSLPWGGGGGPLATRFGELPFDATLIVVCGSGTRSHLASNFLDSEGFLNVYDMGGGMGAWSWEREDCGVEPRLTLVKRGGATELNWTPVPGQQDYTAVRGLLDAVVDAGTHIDLGPVVCLQDDLPYSYVSDAEPPPGGQVFFYLSRQAAGSFGSDADGRERIPASTSCD